MTTEHTAPANLEGLKPKMEMKGVVKKIDLYGALVDVGVGKYGLLHISQLSEEHVNNVQDIVKEGDEVTVWVKEVDRERGRFSLSMIRPAAVEWGEMEPDKVFTGKVVRLERFGAFVDIGAERPGLVHVSELANGYVSDPSDVVSVGDEIQVKIIGVNRRKKQIDLSVRALETPAARAAQEDTGNDEPEEELPTAMALALRRWMETSGEDLPDRGDKSKRRKKGKQRSDAHEDLFARTLEQHRGD